MKGDSVCPLCSNAVCSCDITKNQQNEVIIISAEELKQRMKHNAHIVVINVLTPEYFDDCHIKGSINIPYDKFEESIQHFEKKQEIIVYCANYLCGASKAAFKILNYLGFENIACYEGGILEWKQKGYSVEGPCSLPYLN